MENRKKFLITHCYLNLVIPFQSILDYTLLS